MTFIDIVKNWFVKGNETIPGHFKVVVGDGDLYESLGRLQMVQSTNFEDVTKEQYFALVDALRFCLEAFSYDDGTEHYVRANLGFWDYQKSLRDAVENFAQKWDAPHFRHGQMLDLMVRCVMEFLRRGKDKKSRVVIEQNLAEILSPVFIYELMLLPREREDLIVE